jgi:hypothetical protein
MSNLILVGSATIGPARRPETDLAIGWERSDALLANEGDRHQPAASQAVSKLRHFHEIVRRLAVD